MPDQAFLDSEEPGSDTYQKLVDSTKPEAKSEPEDAEPEPLELTAADSIPPSAPNYATPDVRESLQPAPLPDLSGIFAQDLPPDSEHENLTPKAKKAIEHFQREEIASQLRQNYGLIINEAEYLPLETLSNVSTILIEHTWIADEEQLHEAIIIILSSMDPNFGVKIRGKQKNTDELVQMLLERLEHRDFHIEVAKLKASLPKAHSFPPPLPTN